MEERLQKILAQAGLGLRRDCEELIRAGRVRVNGQVAVLGRKPTHSLPKSRWMAARFSRRSRRCTSRCTSRDLC